MKRYALILKILLGFLATIALAIILLGWRLSNGPIALDWAGDYLKKALVSDRKGVTIDFRDAVLIWREEKKGNYQQTSGLQIIFYDFQLTNTRKEFSLKLPKAGARFSGLAMLRGIIAPTDIELSGLFIKYQLEPEIWQSEDKRPVLDKLEDFLETLKSSNNILLNMTEELLSPPTPSNTAGYLRQITLRDTHILILDQLSGQEWHIPGAYLKLRRTDLGLGVNLSGNINTGNTSIMPVDISLLYNNGSKEAVTILQFSKLRLAALVGEVEALSGLADIDIPLKGNLEFTIDQNFDIPVIGFSFELGEGEINPKNLYKKPLKITSALLNGYHKKADNSVVLEEMFLLLGNTQLNGTGLLYGSFDKPGISIEADIINLPFLDLKSYWPGRFGKGAYKWINRNIDAGIIPQGDLNVYITPEMWDTKLPKDVLTFKFDFDHIKAHYLRPMPILSDLSGSAELNLREFRLSADQGKIEQLTVKKAELLFTDIDKRGKGLAEITVDLDGSVEEILRVIDYKPLGYPSRYGIKPGSITGKASAIVSLKFPLLKKVRLKDVVFDVEAHIEELNILKLTDSLAIQDGQMALHVDGQAIDAEGDIVLNNVPFKAVWQEDFTKTEDFPTKYNIKGIIEGDGWDYLNLPFDPYIEGPVAIDLTLYGKGGAIAKGRGQFDLLNSESSFIPIGWKKPKGQAGLVDFDLEFDEGLLKIRHVHLESDSLQADLELDIKDDFVTRLFVPKLVMQDTDLIMLMAWEESKKYYLASVTGKAFHAEPLIEIITAPTGDEEKVRLPDFDLEAEIEDLLTKNNVRVKSSKITAVYRKNDFTHVNFSGKFADDKNLLITVVPNGKNRQLEFNSNNAGEALRGLGLFNTGVGGDMMLKADMIKHEDGISLGGQATISNFKVINSPGFSKLLTEKKFSKAQEELNKSGLSFSSFDMEFRQYNGVMEINDAHARGPMLGMTIEGTVDQTYDEMNITGTLIPAYGINALLSNIPLIGTILTGGKGQGIFAATYNIKGPLDNPEVNINPLAALAPGILRTIFSAIGKSNKKTLREQAEEMEKIMPDKKSKKTDTPIPD